MVLKSCSAAGDRCQTDVMVWCCAGTEGLETMEVPEGPGEESLSPECERDRE